MCGRAEKFAQNKRFDLNTNPLMAYPDENRFP
jgi:hypothetical protein